MLREPGCGIERVEPVHETVACDLRDDRCSCDRSALLVAVDDCGVRGRERAESEAVDEAHLRRRRQRVQHRAQTGEVRLVQAVAIDVAGGNRAHDDRPRATEDAAARRFAAAREALTVAGRARYSGVATVSSSATGASSTSGSSATGNSSSTSGSSTTTSGFAPL